MSLNFALKKGQTYELTIAPQDAAGQPADLVSGPTVASDNVNVLTAGPVQPVTGGKFKCILTATGKGAANIDIDAVGASPLHEEADGSVTLPLAQKLILSGQVG